MVFRRLTMDFITGLPISNGYATILVVVDRLSKQAHFCALPRSYSEPKVAELFVQMVCKLHGMPRTIISDRDAVFMSKFWSELFQLSGTVLRRTTAYHPQSDRQSEVVNCVLEQILVVLYGRTAS